MRFPNVVPSVIAAAAVPALLLIAAVSSPAAAAPTAVAAATPAPQDVRLPTGELLQVSTAPGGGQSVLVMPSGNGRKEAFTVRTVGGDLYVVPSIAEPYLGRGLELEMFDVTAILRSGGTATRVPVRYDGSAPSGITPSSSGTGYLTAAAATRVGDAMAANVGRAVASGWRAAPALPAKLASLRPVIAAPTVIHPDFDMWTATLRVLDANGRLAPSASVNLLDTDDSSRYSDSPPLFGGTARVSVPAGNYSAIADVTDFDSSGNTIAVREVSIGDLTVKKNTTITLDSRKAGPVSAAAPLPTVTDDVTLDWQRGPAAGSGTSVQSLVGPGIAVYDAPTRAVRVGTLDVATIFDLSSPQTAAQAYQYNLAFPAVGAVPANQRYRVSTATLATLHERFYTDVAGRVAVGARTATLANGLYGLAFAQSFATPLTRTDYVTADPQVRWQDNVAPVFPQTTVSDVPRIYTAGSSATVDWFRGPLVPGFGADAGALTSFPCPACRNGNVLTINLAPTVDSTPGHTEVPFLWGGIHTVADAHVVLASGSTVLRDGQNTFAQSVTVPAGSATYSLTVDETRSASWVRQSTASHTQWTFPSSEPTATYLPPGWTCGSAGAACSVLPLLTVRYQLGASMSGTVPPGPDGLDILISGLPGAAPRPIISTSVRVSYDDGATWVPTTVRSLGSGNFHATWTDPASAAGGDVAIAVSAADAAGATVTQVVHHAYTVTAGTTSEPGR